jgi:guanine deaminase
VRFDDYRFIYRAVWLSQDQTEGGPFGAIVVSPDGLEVGSGRNRVTSRNYPDPTAHAEIEAIRMACSVIKDFKLPGYTLYSSCEPCPMCLAACYWSRISRVVYALTTEDAKSIGFDDQFIYNELSIPVTQRLLVMHQDTSCDKEARSAFRKWQESSELRY